MRSQNDVRTDFIDGGAWNKLKILIYFTYSCMQNTVWITVWCFSIVNYTSVFMSLDFFAQKPLNQFNLSEFSSLPVYKQIQGL